jgi:predicted  nucleic acid-binding Zn-ribbon protein
MVYCEGGSIMNIEKTNKKISELEDKVWDMESVISTVNSETKGIKYNDVPSNIYLAVMGLAEDNGIDEKELEWKIDEVRKCVNKLESAIYDLVEPFEDKKREISNEKEELEMDIEDYEYAKAS